MSKLLTLTLALLLAAAGFAQKRDIDEAIVKSIADYILDHTTFEYVSWSSGQTYKSTKEIPENIVVRFRDQFTEWGYTMDGL